ncbi:MAG TPA: SEC-C metal-binding domain-containing protein, partial [Gaiellaceae bacterium]|nr:SEC-C metal-binding domain-containing protein [Gaiellaceae bacterium]
IATNMAGRGVDIKLGDGVTDLGGLYVLGTERHESRRIDNQLRGRSGRQGDPGETRFYLAGDDELVRLFAGNRIYSIRDRFKLPDDQPMEAGVLSRQIESAQKKVEEQNFVMRKNVLKYDDVMNVQRQVIYAQRRQVLEGEDMSELVHGWIRETVEWVVGEYTQAEMPEEWDLDALVAAMEQLYRTEITVAELREEVGLDRDAIVEEFVDDALDEYKAKEEELEGYEEGLMRNLERFIVLQVVDQRWREHLENMEYLREGIHLRAMAQKDPLTEYRNEGYRMFDELNAQIRQEVVTILFHAEVQAEDAAMLEQPSDGGGPRATDYQHETAAGADAMAVSAAGGSSTALASGGSVSTTVHKSEHETIGRNEPCWCGSGKKYKKCHGA